MNFRLRMISVILAVAIPSAVAGFLSSRIQASIQRRIADLSPESKSKPSAQGLVGRTLSIEGSWQDDGVFLADELEELPWSRRPKLRGAIQEVDPEGGSIVVLGREIRIVEETEHTVQGEPDGPLPKLAVGQRIEVSCAVDSNSQWSARKIETAAIKDSDKVKGTITTAQHAPGSDLRITVDGLEIDVPSHVRVKSPSGPLFRMEVASQMTIALQECLAAAQELSKEELRLREARAQGDEQRIRLLERSVGHARDEVRDSHEGFTHLLETSLALSKSDVEDPQPDPFQRWLVPLSAERSSLGGHVADFLGLADLDVEAAQDYLPEVLEPYLRSRVLPLVNAYRDRTEQDVSAELTALSKSAGTVRGMALWTGLAGLALAMALGYLVARSVASPIRRLEAAARRVGEGDLSTVVDVRSADEIGLLARAFNTMSERLSATMVSVSNLSAVIDSLAGGLFLLDSEGRITSVNPAALHLLGYAREDLVGTPLRSLCSAGGADFDFRTTSERSFQRKDGGSIPATFAGAALRDEQSGTHGYVCLIQDLRERKRLEEDLRRSLGEKELLMRELHHRVKNNLQVISSLLDMQSRAISDPASLEKFQESQDRIRSMVLIHEQLYRAREREAIHMRWYLELLVANLAQSHLEDPERIRIAVEVDEIHLDLDRALACGLIVNELVTNAIKHAFGPMQDGQIVVRCRRAGPERMLLEVGDSGRGFSEREEGKVHASLGMSLVDALTRQLQGELRIDGSRGAVFHVEFPAPELQEVG